MDAIMLSILPSEDFFGLRIADYSVIEIRITNTNSVCKGKFN